MEDGPTPRPTITPETVRTAVGLLSCRFGMPEAEADRRGRVRALLRSSRAFALALDQFAKKAAPHARGEHSTADMHPEADAMAQALADWMIAITSSAETYHACRAPEIERESAIFSSVPPLPRHPLTGV